jgi:aminodeoxyfutalosine synthase
MAEVGQHFGADDIHGTVMEENITHMAGAHSPEDLPENNLLQIIRDAKRQPIQRDSLYNVIQAYQ